MTIELYQKTKKDYKIKKKTILELASFILPYLIST